MSDPYVSGETCWLRDADNPDDFWNVYGASGVDHGTPSVHAVAAMPNRS
jgi:hypothetical protein